MLSRLQPSAREEGLMRIRRRQLTKPSTWLTLCGAIAVMVVGANGPYPPVTPGHTQAAELHSLTADEFHEVALQGFGDANNSYAWAMEWYNNKLYVGTGRAQLCVETEILHLAYPWWLYPPTDPFLAAPCNPVPQDVPLAAEIWALDPSGSPPLTQTNWTEVYQSPYTVPVTITDTSAMTVAPRDMGFRGMSVFTATDGSAALYVSGVDTAPINGSAVPPPSLLRSTDGISFTAVPADPGTMMGSINLMDGDCCLREQLSNAGEFYLAITKFSGSGSVFASSTPNRGDDSFRRVTPITMGVTASAFFNDHLYIGGSTAQGYTVWRNQTDCIVPSCHPTFMQLIPPGGGLGASGNSDVLSLHVYTDTANIPHLYVGTDGAHNGTPAEIVRLNLDDSWDLIMGNPRVVNGVSITPTSGLSSGFGWPLNQHVWSMEDYNGVLYAGTYDASTLWKDNYPPFDTPLMGFDLWASTDGLTFTPVTVNGFGDIFSFGARTMKATPYGLFVGSANWDQGLRIWQGALSSDALKLAPTDLTLGRAQHAAAIALRWHAPANATLFHVYRSTPSPTYGRLGALRTRSPFVEIGSTRAPSFVDHGAHSGESSMYYVVAQDGAGDLSQPSNAVSAAVPSF